MAGPPQKPAANGDSWDEAAIEQALKDLKKLHIAVRNMRQTIPRLSERINASRTPEEMGAATRDARKEVVELKQMMTSPENTKMLERAKQSRKDDPKIKPWRPKDEPNWFMPDE